jgi:hypothetical protein
MHGSEGGGAGNEPALPTPIKALRAEDGDDRDGLVFTPAWRIGTSPLLTFGDSCAICYVGFILFMFKVWGARCCL